MDGSFSRRGYAVAAAALLLATLLRFGLDPLLGEQVPVATYIAAAAMVGLFAGVGPGLLTLLLGGLLAALLFMAPRGQLWPLDTAQASSLALYFISAGLVLVLIGQLRASRTGLAASRRESERQSELLRRITDSVPMLLSFVDRDLRYQYVSAGYEKWFGRPASDIRGSAVRDLVGEEIYARIEPQLRRALAGETVQIDNRLTLPEGSVRDLRSHYFPVQRGGEIEGVSVVVLDVTDRRRLEERDRELAAIVMGAQEAIVTTDLAGRVLRWNPGATSVYGYTAEDMVGSAIARLVPPEHRQEVTRIGAEVRAGRPVAPFETVRVRKDGSRIDILLSAAPICDAGGAVRAIATIERDITQRKQAEAALRTSEARLQAIVEHSPVPVFIKDLEGRYLLANPAYLTLCGTRADQLLGITDFQRLPFELAAQFTSHDREVIASGQAREFEESLEIEGALRTYVSIKFPLRDVHGAVHAVCCIAAEITDQKRQQEELREVDRRKDQFLSMLAHELRNPLAPIVNAVQVLRLGDRTEWAADVIERQAMHLTHLVDDLLDIARINSGRIQLRLGPVELVALVRQCFEGARPLFRERGLTLTLDLPAAPLVVEGDEARLVQVLDNLLNNAAKYTDSGGQVHLALERDGADHCLLRVRDTGIGIEPSYLPRVFDLFEQADVSLDRSGGGLGLGLNLVQRLVHMHGGEVEAHSDGSGQGSEFRVRLPLLAAAAPQTHTHKPLVQDSIAPRRVLVIEDNHDVAQSMEMLLLALGQDVRVAHSGGDGIELAEHFGPQLVITDIGLPDRSGFEVAQTLRQRYGDRLRLVALSGYGQQEYRERSDAAGFDEHLVKPPSVEALVRAIENTPERTASPDHAHEH